MVKYKTLPRPVERWSDKYLEHPLLLWSLLDTNVPTKMWTTVFKTQYHCFHFQICLLKTKSRSICFWPQTQMELLIIILSLIQKSVSLEARSPGQRWSLWGKLLQAWSLKIEHSRCKDMTLNTLSKTPEVTERIVNVHHKICFETKRNQIHFFLVHSSFTVWLWC